MASQHSLCARIWMSREVPCYSASCLAWGINVGDMGGSNALEPSNDAQPNLSEVTGDTSSLRLLRHALCGV